MHQHKIYNPKDQENGDYRGLLEYISSTHIMKVAQSWGVWPSTLYNLCRSHNVQVVEEAISLVNDRPDWYFRRNNVPVAAQRGRYFQGVVRQMAKMQGDNPVLPDAPEPVAVVGDDYRPSTGHLVYDRVLQQLPRVYRSTGERLKPVSIAGGRVRMMALDDGLAKFVGQAASFKVKLAEAFSIVLGGQHVVEIA
jgi:hypothetical protein